MDSLVLQILGLFGIVTALLGAGPLIVWLFLSSRLSALKSLSASLRIPFERFQLSRHGLDSKISDWSSDAQEGALRYTFTFEHTVARGRRPPSVEKTSVVCMQWSTVGFPTFRVQPQWFGGRNKLVTHLVGMGSIRIDTNPAFTKMFRIWGRNRFAVRRLFCDEAVELLATHPAWMIEAYGGTAVCYQEGLQLSPPELQGFLTEATWLLSLLARESRTC